MGVLKKRSSINTMIIIVFLSLMAKVVGFARDAFIGYRYGAGSESDIYFSAIGLTTILFLGVGSAIATNIIPLIVRAQKDVTLKKSIAHIFSWIVMLSIIIGALLFIGAPSIVKLFVAGYSDAKLMATAGLVRIMLPTILLITIMYFFVGVLQANELFIRPAVTSFPANLLFFAYLAIGVEQFGVIGLAVTTLIGWFVQLMIVTPKVIKEKLVLFQGFQFKMDRETRKFFIDIVPIIFITLTHQFNILLDNQSASFFGDGNVSAIYFGNMIFTAITTVTVYGITAVMFPKFNHKYLDNDLDSFYQTVVNVLRSVGLLLIPMSVGLIVLGPYVIKIIFENGVFDAEDTATTIIAFTGYTSLMLAFGMIDVLNKAFYTMNNRRAPLVVGVIITISNLAITSLLIKAVGFKGIPIGTSVAFYIGAVISFIMFYRNNRHMKIGLLVDSILKSIGAALAMGVVIKIMDPLLTTLFTASLLSDMMVIVMDVVIGVAVYVMLLILLKEKLVYHRVKQVMNKVMRRS